MTASNPGSPTVLRRISRIYDTVEERPDDSPDSGVVGGGAKRQRHASGLGFDPPPLGDTFTDRELVAYLAPFVDAKIRSNKIYRHLTSYQSQGRNFPAVDTKSTDSGNRQEGARLDVAPVLYLFMRRRSGNHIRCYYLNFANANKLKV
jgi:hypothetical protein